MPPANFKARMRIVTVMDWIGYLYSGWMIYTKGMFQKRMIMGSGVMVCCFDKDGKKKARWA